MASHEVDNAELGSASAHGTPGSEAGPEELNTSVYQPIDGSPDYQKAKLQVLGSIQREEDEDEDLYDNLLPLNEYSVVQEPCLL
ncbi:membrane spanning 4-domains A3 [Homo sapiens]|uniref:Membrane spanning 4-domains A3 n=1 Tax=Homo sapiens TaxID=9606 RepID=E9PRW8_HUMAN|nr:membrane spanning 4-domains A3 [Homo sapiens]KAI4071494.1 membrane spanning 4-domains A3 [Homo sapiens]